MKPNEWYARGQRAGPSATKYRKGACQNCGAMTHTAQTCLERPRKLGAKYTGKGIQADEIVRSFDQSFEGKRDRWNGYDNQDFLSSMEDYEKLEEARKKLKEMKNQSDVENNRVSDDEDKYEFEPENRGGDTYDSYTRTSTRNLRLREDTGIQVFINFTNSYS
jgi:pre-mRNA-processing factor SLU7